MQAECALIRATFFHTPRNPFLVPDALVAVADGAVAIRDGRLEAAGPFAELRRAYPSAPVDDRRPGILFPGLVDLHTHFPQARMIGAMGGTLLEWLRSHTLPEEARLADVRRARNIARDCLAALARNGTTTALVFGTHFAAAQDIFFEEAERSGLRITSGLVLSDRELPPALLQSPRAAHADSLRLGNRWHARGRLGYAVSPRFALSCSEAMLEVAGDLLARGTGWLLQTHLDESVAEVDAVRRAFPWACDYLAVYGRFGLVNARSVLAHSIHPSPGELARLASTGAAVAHCPSSNLFLASGLFPLREHVERRVRVGLGSDVAAGTGFSLFKEGLAAFTVQALLPDGWRLTPAHLLYLATLGGAVALGRDAALGDLTAGKAADLCLLLPREESTLASVLANADSPEEALGAIFTLAGEADVAACYVAGEPVYLRSQR